MDPEHRVITGADCINSWPEPIRQTISCKYFYLWSFRSQHLEQWPSTDLCSLSAVAPHDLPLPGWCRGWTDETPPWALLAWLAGGGRGLECRDCQGCGKLGRWRTRGKRERRKNWCHGCCSRGCCSPAHSLHTDNTHSHYTHRAGVTHTTHTLATHTGQGSSSSPASMVKAIQQLCIIRVCTS